MFELRRSLNHQSISRLALHKWRSLKVREGRLLFPSRVHEQPQIATRQIEQACGVDGAVVAIVNGA
jgi:hypothetical protein